jgi:vancomycin resistance protein VanW
MWWVRPTSARGFLPGRSLLAGELRPDYGGGLCQLSGLIYNVSLMAGLEVLERHPLPGAKVTGH